jgi:hypothetical protein
MIPKENLICSMNCGQIWLNPILDDCQSTYLANLKRKTLIQIIKKKAKKPFYLLWLNK